jgi:tetratricopeptide (TPR) repeat protein
LQPESVSESTRALLREALALHERNDFAGAIERARVALEETPHYADARAYIGSTLVQRLARYGEGLAELRQAAASAPDDAAVQYTLGWCAEFVAHRVSRRPVEGLDPLALYAEAERALRRCLELNPEGKLRDDAADLLSSIIREDVP